MQWDYLRNLSDILLSFQYQNLSKIVEKLYLLDSPGSYRNPGRLPTVLKFTQCPYLCLYTQWHRGESCLADANGLNMTELAFHIKKG